MNFLLHFYIINCNFFSTFLHFAFVIGTYSLYPFPIVMSILLCTNHYDHLNPCWTTLPTFLKWKLHLVFAHEYSKSMLVWILLDVCIYECLELGFHEFLQLRLAARAIFLGLVAFKPTSFHLSPNRSCPISYIIS